MNDVMRIDFKTGIANSYGELVEGTERDVCVLFNTTVVSAEEVYELINSDGYKFDRRIVVTTPVQADNLRSR